MKKESIDALGAVPIPGQSYAAHAFGACLDGCAWCEIARRSPAGVVERYRRAIPDAVAGVTQLVVDNPAQFALMFAGMVVIGAAARNLVKPKTAAEALALAIVLQFSLPLLGGEAIKRGWLRFRIRDADGCLVPLEISDDPAD